MNVIKMGVMTLLIFFSQCVFANDGKAVVDQYMQALIASDYNKAASFLDKKTLQDFKHSIVEIGQLTKDKNQYDQVAKHLFPQFKTLENLKAANPQSVFAQLLKGVMSQPQMRDILEQSQYQFIGIVKENESAAYAVIKLKMAIGGEIVDSTDVVPLIVNDGQYAVGLKADIKAMLIGLKSQFKQ